MRDQKRKTDRSKARALKLADSRKRVKLIDGIIRRGHAGNPNLTPKERQARKDAVAKKLAAYGFEIRVNRPQPMGSREERKKANIARRARLANKGGNNHGNKTKTL
jgi:hypothetical protein